MNSHYHFVTRWRVAGAVEEVASILEDAPGLARWWPSVYLDVRLTDPGGAAGTGAEVALHTKGWLPYTLRWQFRVTAIEPPCRVVLEPMGDFTGRGTWTFAQDGPWAVIGYEWDVETHKPLLRALGWLLRPVFAANHDWAMRRGEESLRLELLRRRAATSAQRARVPPPPGRSRLTMGAGRAAG